jgi:hypothetical protein
MVAGTDGSAESIRAVEWPREAKPLQIAAEIFPDDRSPQVVDPEIAAGSVRRNRGRRWPPRRRRSAARLPVC